MNESGSYIAQTVSGETVNIVDKQTHANQPSEYTADDGTVYIQDGNNFGLLTVKPPEDGEDGVTDAPEDVSEQIIEVEPEGNRSSEGRRQ